MISNVLSRFDPPPDDNVDCRPGLPGAGALLPLQPGQPDRPAQRGAGLAGQLSPVHCSHTILQVRLTHSDPALLATANANVRTIGTQLTLNWRASGNRSHEA